MDKKCEGSMSSELAAIRSDIETLLQQFDPASNNVQELMAIAERVHHIVRELDVYGFFHDEEDDPEFLAGEESCIEESFGDEKEQRAYRELFKKACCLEEDILMKLATHEDVLGRRWCAYQDGMLYPSIGNILNADKDPLVQFIVADACYGVSLQYYIANGDIRVLDILKLMADSGIEGLAVEAVDGLCCLQQNLSSFEKSEMFQHLRTDIQHLLRKLTKMCPPTDTDNTSKLHDAFVSAGAKYFGIAVPQHCTAEKLNEIFAKILGA